MNPSPRILALTIGLVSLAASVPAQLVTITDTTPGSSVRDGVLNAGEYGGLTYFSSGIGSGFGNVLGSGSQIYFDSSTGGAVNLGLQLGGGSLNDVAVIYIDSVGGGFSDTTTINDNGDPGRAAVSGNGTGGGTSELTFAAGFTADYAISIQDGFAGVFQLASGGSGSLNFITTLSLTPTGNASFQQREGEWLLSQIGLIPGGSFKYVATYLNAGNAFRSDELHGHSTALGGNIGQNPFTFDNYNVFVTAVPEPGSFALLGMGLVSLLVCRRRKT